MHPATPIPATGIHLAADIGGTFTDLVLETPDRRFSRKVLTTPRAPEEAVMAGIAALLDEAAVRPADVALFIHGTTLATNALIERKGARTALLTTEGLRDVLAMGYEKRFDVHDLAIELPCELVPRPRRFTVRERIAADGSVLAPLDDDGVRRAGEAMRAAGAEAAAIGFLHAWSHPRHELRAREILQSVLGDGVTICLSHEVCPEIREYERLSTTVANAYVRPLMGSYLMRLQDRVRALGLAGPMLVMMSGGGLTTLAQAARFPIRLVESGPAGGAILAADLARRCGLDRVLAFDMGGTTAKVCLINDGEPERSRRFEVDRQWNNLKGSGLPVRIPVIELVEIGAGGGSLGRVDALGRLTVGPDSCGAEPGPASYGRDGAQPAVTDANLVLGRIDPAHFAGGRLALDPAAAARALEQHIGQALAMDAHWSAVGMSEVVEENMANAARVHAIERGQDLTGVTMIAFGGAAPLHAGRLAQKLGIRRVLVPAGAGVGSAIGFLRAPIAYEVVRSALLPLAGADPVAIEAGLQAMAAEALAVVAPAGGDQTLATTRVAELRYAGQGHELRVRLPEAAIDAAALANLVDRFEQLYAQVYGQRVAGSPVEVVTWSVTVSTVPQPPPRSRLAPPGPVRAPEAWRRSWEPAQGASLDFAQHWRFDLQPGDQVRGPALVVEHETTVVVPAGWRLAVDDQGHLHLQDDTETAA